jgi:hypothetical protein
MNISELDLTKSVVDLSIQIEARAIEALIDSGAPQEESASVPLNSCDSSARLERIMPEPEREIGVIEQMLNEAHWWVDNSDPGMRTRLNWAHECISQQTDGDRAAAARQFAAVPGARVRHRRAACGRCRGISWGPPVKVTTVQFVMERTCPHDPAVSGIQFPVVVWVEWPAVDADPMSTCPAKKFALVLEESQRVRKAWRMVHYDQQYFACEHMGHIIE